MKCTSFSIYVSGRNFICKDCGYQEIVADAVIRAVKEFKLLFPEQKITTNVIHDWCKVVNSKKRIKRILETHYKIVGVHQWPFMNRFW